MSDMSEGTRCFVIIALTTTGVTIGDLIARAFFYEQTQYIATFLPLIIGGVALFVMGIMRRNRNKPETSVDRPNTAGIRRVRVTGPVK